MRFAEITGWGKALPPLVLSNADLETIVSTEATVWDLLQPNFDYYGRLEPA